MCVVLEFVKAGGIGSVAMTDRLAVCLVRLAWANDEVYTCGSIFQLLGRSCAGDVLKPPEMKIRIF